MCLLFLCFATVAFGQSDRTELMSGVARVIRMDQITPTATSLPQSTTGALISEDGHVMTAFTPEIVSEAEHANGGYLVSKPENKVEYLVLFPVFETNKDGSHGVVNAVKVYRGVYHSSSMESKLCFIKIPEDALPYVIPIESNRQNTFESGNALTAYGYMHTPTVDSQEKSQTSVIAINKFLRACKARLADGHSWTSAHIVSNVNEDKAEVMNYMSAFAQNCAYSEAVGNRGQSRSFSHTAVLRGNCCKGAIIVQSSPTTDAIIGIINDSDFQRALDSSVICGVLNEKNVGAKHVSESKKPIPFWIWIAIGVVGIVLLITIILIVVKANGGKKVVVPPVPTGAGQTETVHTHESSVIMILKGESGERYEVTSQMVRDRVTLGRSSSAGLQFNKSTVSSTHARLCKTNGRPGIEDLDSKGGTYVNGKKLKPGVPTVLHKDDVIKLADYTVKVKGA